MEVFFTLETLFSFMIFEIRGFYDIHIYLKTGQIQAKWKTGLSRVIFITCIKIATCTKKWTC